MISDRDDRTLMLECYKSARERLLHHSDSMPVLQSFGANIRPKISFDITDTQIKELINVNIVTVSARYVRNIIKQADRKLPFQDNIKWIVCQFENKTQRSSFPKYIPGTIKIYNKEEDGTYSLIPAFIADTTNPGCHKRKREEEVEKRSEKTNNEKLDEDKAIQEEDETVEKRLADVEKERDELADALRRKTNKAKKFKEIITQLRNELDVKDQSLKCINVMKELFEVSNEVITVQGEIIAEQKKLISVNSEKQDVIPVPTQEAPSSWHPSFYYSTVVTLFPPQEKNRVKEMTEASCDKKRDKKNKLRGGNSHAID